MFLVSICRLGILGPAVELRHLRYFVAVAEMENVSRAALKLHVSQPALSRQICDLEDEIGFCLLERTAKSVRLTDAGRAFLNDARTLLQQADEAVKKARAIASAEPTELKVGYSPAATARILPPILRAYQRVMPKAHVKLHDWSNEENVAGLRDASTTSLCGSRFDLGALYFGSSRCAQPLPSRLHRPCRSPRSLHSGQM
jgi:DNA-binding transcriptional LysR family regulator